MADHAPRFLKVVNDAKQRVQEISISDVRRKIERDAADFHLLDVREESEWEKGHVPQATHLGKGVIERDIEKMIPDTDAEIICYCGGGYRSALVADSLQKMGYTNVWSMAGGFREWKESGLQIESGSR